MDVEVGVDNNIHISIDYDAIDNKTDWAITTSDSPCIKYDNELSKRDCVIVKHMLRLVNAWINNQKGKAINRDSYNSKNVQQQIQKLLDEL